MPVRAADAQRQANMEDVPRIIVKRFPYEEPYHTQVEFGAWNGFYGGSLDIYCAVDDLREIGMALAAFPSKVPDEYSFEYGSEDPAKRCYRYLKFRAYTFGGRGHCALQFSMNLNAEEPDEGSCRFSIRAEPA